MGEPLLTYASSSEIDRSEISLIRDEHGANRGSANGKQDAMSGRSHTTNGDRWPAPAAPQRVVCPFTAIRSEPPDRPSLTLPPIPNWPRRSQPRHRRPLRRGAIRGLSHCPGGATVL